MSKYYTYFNYVFGTVSAIVLAILSLADGIFYVNWERCRDCMMERDRFLVDCSTILFSVYNGEKRGGIAATVRYARKMEREIFTLALETLSLTHEIS